MRTLRPFRRSGGLLEAAAGRHVRDSGALTHAHELRVCTEPEPAVAEDAVTDRELLHRGADCLDLARKFAAKDPLPRPAEARDHAAENRHRQAAASVGFAGVDVQPVDRGGVDLDEDLILLGDRPLDVFEALDLRRPVRVVDNCFHAVSAW